MCQVSAFGAKFLWYNCQMSVTLNGSIYCIFGNFSEIWVSRITMNNLDIFGGHVKDSQLERDLPKSVNDRVISSFCEGLFLTNIRTREVS